jgi:hypothetical protein
VAIPSWRQQLPQNLAGAQKWGTGINPVHAQKYGNNDVGRNLAPGAYNGVALEEHGIVDSGNLGYTGYEFGFTAEDLEMTGGADFSFMEAHPNLDVPPTHHGQTGQFPSWGKGGDPIPGGTAYRSLKIGSAWKEQIPQQQPYGTVGEGWINKPHGEINDSRISDESQLIIQTSMMQRDLTKTNDLAVARGTDDPRSGIATRLQGMKEKFWSGGIRHEQMMPKEQNERARPWLYRTAGVGEYEGVNDMYVAVPYVRAIPPDAYQGQVVDDLSNVDDVWTDY